MKVSISAEVFKPLLMKVSELVIQGNLLFTQEGLKICQFDESNVTMVVLNLLPSSFIEYQITEPTKVLVTMESLKKILRLAKDDTVITLELDDRLWVTLAGKNKKRFGIALLTDEMKDAQIPSSLKFSAKATIDTSDFKEAIDSAEVVAASVWFQVKEGKLIHYAEGDINTVAISDMVVEDADLKVDCIGKYSVEYLKKMIYAKTEKMTVLFGNDYPLMLKYEEKDKWTLKYILAPRVENN
jgi:DNA polymerase III sliding clamp (beta) subunit (PCNA family)